MSLETDVPKAQGWWVPAVSVIVLCMSQEACFAKGGLGNYCDTLEGSKINNKEE